MPRRTKKQYADLYDNPGALFPGCKVMLWPNGQPEIWINGGTHSIRIKAAVGPAGMSLTVNRFVGGAPLSVTGNLFKDSEPLGMLDCEEVAICQYNDDEHSKAFKAWYADPDNNPYPGK
jgi:hypothetical protein